MLSLFLRPLILQDPTAGAPLLASSSSLPALFPQCLHKPHALCWQHPPREACGQLPWWQRRSAGVWTSGRGLGGLWGHILGPCLPDTTVSWCLHQSLCLQLLDTQGDWTWWQKREKAMKGEWWTLKYLTSRSERMTLRLTWLIRWQLIQQCISSMNNWCHDAMTWLPSDVSYNLTFMWRGQGNAGLYILQTFYIFCKVKGMSFLSKHLFCWFNIARMDAIKSQENLNIFFVVSHDISYFTFPLKCFLCLLLSCCNLWYEWFNMLKRDHSLKTNCVHACSHANISSK